MYQKEMRKAITIILGISLALFTTNTIVEVHAKSYSFTATISPTQININQPATFLMTITNTGEGTTLGSASIAIPTGFAIQSNITILNPTTLWNYTLSTTSIDLSADGGGSVINQGENVTFTFNATAPSSSRVANWIAEATTSIDGGGVLLTLQGEQPSVTVISSPFTPPTILASPSTINSDQISFISQLTGASEGTPPYTYQWLEAFDGGIFSPIAEANGSDFIFSPTTSTPVGAWSFKLNVTDSSAIPETVTSNTVNVLVNSALVAPQVTADPNTVTQAQPSTLNSSQVTTGTFPYTYQWFQQAPGDLYTTVGGNSPGYSFPGSTTIGDWAFILQVTDGTGASVNSSAASVTVVSTPIFTITVTQAAHGAINPGTVSVSYGSDQSFIISADVGYFVADVLVDGISVGTVASFDFVNLTSDHNLTAIFTPVEYTLVVSAVGDGSVALSPDQATYHYGDVVQLTAIPTLDWRFSVWSGDLTGSLNPSTLTIDGNKAVAATFVINQLTITASASVGGSISPSGTVSVTFGSDQIFMFSFDSGYSVSDVLVDGVSIGAVSSYVFTSVASDHTIVANFAANSGTYHISVVSTYGSPTPSAEVNAGDSFSVTVTSPEGDANHQRICTGYSRDGGAPVSGTSYIFTNVQADHNITFNWQEQYYLTVISSVGSTTGEGWYDVGTTTSVSLSSSTVSTGSNTREVFTGWSGDASGAGPTSSLMTIDGAKTAITNWATQYQVTYATSGNVLEVIGPSAEWVNSGSTATGEFPALITNSAGDTRVVFVSDDSPSNVNQPLTVTGTFQTQYRVMFNQDGMDSDASGIVITALNGTKTFEQLPDSAWVNAGDSITFSYIATVGTRETGKQYILASSNCTSPLVISEPTTIQGIYQLQVSSSGFVLDTFALIAIIVAVAIPASVTAHMVVRRRRGKSKNIRPISGEGGAISPSTVQTIDSGGDSTVFIIAANDGFEIKDVLIDNAVHLGAVRTYKFVNVTRDHTISAIYQRISG